MFVHHRHFLYCICARQVALKVRRHAAHPSVSHSILDKRREGPKWIVDGLSCYAGMAAAAATDAAHKWTKLNSLTYPMGVYATSCLWAI